MNTETTNAVGKYSCINCSISFDRLDNFQAHLRLHTGECPYSCSLCDKNFKFKIDLDYHLRNIHQPLNPIKCAVCYKQFNSLTSLKRHEKGVHPNGKAYKCLKCNQIYYTARTLYTHVATHEDTQKFGLESSSESLTYICKFCSKTFADRRSLIRHTLIAHLRKYSNRSTKEEPSSTPITVEEDSTNSNLLSGLNTNEENYETTENSETVVEILSDSEDTEQLLPFIQISSNTEEEDIIQELSSDSEHVDDNLENNSITNESTDTATETTIHDLENFEDDVSTTDSIQEEVIETEIETNLDEDNVCTNDCTQEQDISEVNERETDRNLDELDDRDDDVAVINGADQDDIEDRDDDVAVINGDDQDDIEDSFGANDFLKIEISEADNNDSMKNSAVTVIKCADCDKMFHTMEDLVKHRDAKKSFPCHVCGVHFSNRIKLSRHKITHTDLRKRFVCEVCSIYFDNNCHMQLHLRTHTGERPFACPICERSFVQKGNMRKHLKTHTKKKTKKRHKNSKKLNVNKITNNSEVVTIIDDDDKIEGVKIEISHNNIDDTFIIPD